MKTRLQAAAELLRAGRLAEAKAKLLKELRLSPQSAPALELLGAVSSGMGRHEEAIGYLRRAAGFAPTAPGPHLNLGTALIGARRYAEAADTLRQAIDRWPDIPEARLSHGNALLALGKREQAAEAYRAALRLNPRRAAVCANLALALHGLQDHEATCQACERLLELDRSSVAGQLLLAVCRQMLCNWEAHEPGLARAAELISHAHSTFGMAFAALLMWDDGALHRRCAELEARLYAGRMKLPPPAKLQARSKDRIRVAYVSADFRRHPIAALVTGLVEEHDRSRFEIVGVSLGEDDGSPERQRLVQAFDTFLDVRDRPADAVAAAMRTMEVDIAVDLMGYTTGCRPAIFLERVAPVQVSYLGFPGTSGIDAMDYLVADPFIAGGDLSRAATEKLAVLPHCYQCNDGKRALPADLPSRAACGLPENAFIFCSFNHAQKLTPEVFGIWMGILGQTEGSVLWLLKPGGATERNLLREAQRHGIDPERIVLADRVEHRRHLARNGVADLHLDTFPYGAHTTASDALWAGAPILTRAGLSFPTRVCASLLATIGVPELITTSAEDYAAMALRLACDRPGLADLRRRIAHGRAHSPLFDTPRYCCDLERAYTAMIERSRAGKPPAEIDVGSLAGAS
jgi:protein O-GlcNAc transferase